MENTHGIPPRVLGSPGRRMPDGWTRQRLRTAVSRLQQDYRYGDSPFVGFVWFVVTLLSLVPAEGAPRGPAVTSL